MAVEAVVFDVGETLVDESYSWLAAAKATGVTPFKYLDGWVLTRFLKRELRQA